MFLQIIGFYFTIKGECVLSIHINVPSNSYTHDLLIMISLHLLKATDFFFTMKNYAAHILHANGKQKKRELN